MTGADYATPPRGSDSLLERGRELASIQELVDGVARGQARLALVEGPAGLGKTRLLGEIRTAAASEGMTVLAARASELERDFPFGVVRQLCEPLLADESRRRTAFSGPAESARTVFEHPSAGGDGDSADASFAALHGLHWLTVNLSAEGPLLLEIDDLQWADRPSLRFIAYLLRRLEGLPVLMAATLRTTDPGTDPDLLGEIATDPSTVPIRPSLLSDAAVLELVRERLGVEADEDFSRACHVATGGNPLLLRQLLSSLEADHVRPSSSNAGLVGDIGPRAVSRTVLLRLARLSEQAIAVARSVAVLGHSADIATVAGVAELEEASVAEATGALVKAEILKPDLPLGFVHPLVLDAVYQDLSPGERELLHTRAAELLRRSGARSDEVATHLLAVPSRGDAEVTEVLLEAARSAAHQGAPENAVTYFARALREPPPDERRAETLFALGLAEVQTSGADATEHLREAHALLRDPLERGTAAYLLARTLMFTGRQMDAAALCRASAAELPSELPDLALAFDALELMCQYFGPRDPVAGKRLKDYRAGRPPGTGVGAKMIAAVTAWDWSLDNGPADACAALAREALQDGTLIEADNGLFPVPAAAVLAVAESDEGLRAFDALLENAHRSGLFAALTADLWRGWALMLRGDLAEAEQSQREALDETRLWGSAVPVANYPVAFLTQIQVERGDLAGAAATLAGSDDPGAGPETGHLWLRSRLELDLAQGRPETVLTDIEEYRLRLGTIVNPVWAPWRSLEARALDRLGRREEGMELIEAELALAREWGASGAIGHALRVLGTLQREGGFDSLEEAVAVLEGSPARLERAKALAALGSHLRRARRPTDAREPLRRALELAGSCGADGLAEHVRSELYATGARPRTEATQGAQALTTSERRVAELAADGQTNRDIAQGLFVTPKTVEVHLTSVYRKLGISSRRELKAALV